MCAVRLVACAHGSAERNAALPHRSTMTRSFRSTRPRRSVDDLSVLFGSAWADVVGFAHRRVGCAALAEDIAAIVFAEAVRAHERGVQIERGWLFTVARNKMMAYFEVHRRDARNKQNALEFFLDQKLADKAGTEDYRMDALRHCLAELNPSIRDILEKRYNGVSVRQLADDLGRSISAVKMTLLRTRSSLRDCVRSQI